MNDFYDVMETEQARANAHDPEAVANALVEGVRPDTARELAAALLLLAQGRHDDADPHARAAIHGLMREFLEA